jgi:hypothetical protein
MKIASFDRPLVRQVSEEAEAALAAVAEKYGLTITRQPGRFSPDRLTLKIDLIVATETGAPADYASKAALIGLPEDSWGKTFIASGTEYTITEINLRRPKYPVSGTGPKGGRYKFAAAAVKMGLALAQARQQDGGGIDLDGIVASVTA